MVQTHSVIVHQTKAEASRRRSGALERKITFHYNSITSPLQAVNAQTGEPYPFNAGSKDMFRCYVSTMTIHPPKIHPRRVARVPKVRPAGAAPAAETKETVRLFYDTPEQYEEHTGTVLSDRAKERWSDVQHELVSGTVVSGTKTYEFKY
jgi:hypothetical protein